MLVIQTDGKFLDIKDHCLNSWEHKAKSQGYSVIKINFREKEGSFLDNLIDCCSEANSTFVVVGFDDLYCTKFSVPYFDDLKHIFKKYSPDVVRLDGRVPGLGALAFSIDDINYYSHKGAYQCSTVFSAFSKKFLIRCRDNGVASAWDLEKVSYRDILAFAPRKRTIKYDNYIVKGRIDPTLYNSDLFIGFWFAYRRKFYRFTHRLTRRIAILLTLRK